MTDAEDAGKRVLAQDAVRRAAERREAGARLLPRRLPENKSQDPKLLCLDQNKWIDLGRAHYGKEGGAPFRAALETVRAAIAAGKLVVAVLGAKPYQGAGTGGVGRGRRRP